MIHPIPQRAGPAVNRSARWAALLDRRPASGDSSAMSAWLLEVLSVSDGRGKAPVQPEQDTGGSENDEKMQSPSSTPKKRLYSQVTSSSTGSSSPREKEMGSFSEWKDRKKQRRPPNQGCTSPQRD